MEKTTMKKIKIINGRSQAFFLETAAITLDELLDALKSEQKLSGVDFEGVKILQRDSQGRTALDYGEQKISTDEEFKVFLIAEKMKFGEDNVTINGQEFTIKLLKEMHTKMNNLFNALLDGQSEEQINQTIEESKEKCEVTDQDLQDMEEFVRS